MCIRDSWYTVYTYHIPQYYYFKKWKTSAVSTTDGWLKLNFATCVIRQTRSFTSFMVGHPHERYMSETSLDVTSFTPWLRWLGYYSYSVLMTQNNPKPKPLKLLKTPTADRAYSLVLMNQCWPWAELSPSRCPTNCCNITIAPTTTIIIVRYTCWDGRIFI